ncbi:MAG: hypothetical protein KC592_10445, partial [Nitrospira sp.]|nr:hypothetical protein [Nitrospira sp.]
AWVVPLLFSGIVACQEETESINNSPVEPTVPGTTQELPPPSVNSDMPNPSTSSDQPSKQARSITGEVMSIEDQIYMIRNSENEEIRVEANSMTLVDEGIEVGDKAEIRYSVDEKPLSIRKLRRA